MVKFLLKLFFPTGVLLLLFKAPPLSVGDLISPGLLGFQIFIWLEPLETVFFCEYPNAGCWLSAVESQGRVALCRWTKPWLTVSWMSVPLFWEAEWVNASFSHPLGAEKLLPEGALIPSWAHMPAERHPCNNESSEVITSDLPPWAGYSMSFGLRMTCSVPEPAGRCLCPPSPAGPALLPWVHCSVHLCLVSPFRPGCATRGKLLVRPFGPVYKPFPVVSLAWDCSQNPDALKLEEAGGKHKVFIACKSVSVLSISWSVSYFRHPCKWCHMIFIFVWLTSLSMIISRSIHAATNAEGFILFL